MKPVLALLLLTSPALAQSPSQQSPPHLLPSHDVTIAYHASGEATHAIPGLEATDLRVSWSATGQRLRVDAEGWPQSLLVDLAAGRVQVIDPSLRTSLSLPVRPGDLQPLKLEGAHLTRRGRATVAGRPCTEYTVQSARGHGVVCLTEDGIALKGSGEVNGRAGSFAATSVDDAGVSPSLFQVPPGYVHLAIPGGSRLP